MNDVRERLLGYCGDAYVETLKGRRTQKIVDRWGAERRRLHYLLELAERLIEEG
jgi:hypothetical protein